MSKACFLLFFSYSIFLLLIPTSAQAVVEVYPWWRFKKFSLYTHVLGWRKDSGRISAVWLWGRGATARSSYKSKDRITKVSPIAFQPFFLTNYGNHIVWVVIKMIFQFFFKNYFLSNDDFFLYFCIFLYQCFNEWFHLLCRRLKLESLKISPSLTTLSSSLMQNILGSYYLCSLLFAILTINVSACFKS